MPLHLNDDTEDAIASVRSTVVSTPSAAVRPTEPPVRTVRMGNSDVPINPATGRPQPGFIIDAGTSSARKIPWQASDIEKISPKQRWYNHTDVTQVCFNGVVYRFPAGEEVELPGVIIAEAIQSFNASKHKDDAPRARGGTVQVGALGPREY